MNWGSASEFFAMGGYGLYVWGSYGVAFVALLVEPLLAARRHRQALASIAESSFEPSFEQVPHDAPRSGES